MSPILVTFLQTTLLPAVLVAVGLLLTGKMAEPMRGRVQALIIGLGYVLGAFILIKRLNIPPFDVNESFSVVALLLILFVWSAPRAMSARYAVRAVFVVAIGLLLLWPLRESLNSPVHYRNLLAFFFLALGVWSILEKTANIVSPITLITLPLIAASALSIFMVFAASIAFSQLVTVACGILGAALGIAVVFGGRLSTVAVVPFVSVFLIAFMAAAHFYLDVNPWKMIMLCIPFFILWIREWLTFLPRKSWLETIVLAILSALPLAYVLWNASVEAGPLY